MSKPIENVRTLLPRAACISATTVDESMPPGQECAERHVGDHAAADGILQQCFQLFGQLGVAAVERTPHAVASHGAGIPEPRN